MRNDFFINARCTAKFVFWVLLGREYIFFLEKKYITPGACGLLPEFLLSYLHLLSYVSETVTFLQISLFIGCIFDRIVLFLSFAILSSPERFDQSEYISEHSWLYLITVLTKQTLISLIIQSGNKDYSTKWLLCCRHTV